MDTALTLLAEWLPRQRWYTRSARPPRLRLLADDARPALDPTARIRVLVVSDDAAPSPVVLQIPIVVRREQEADASPGAIGTTADGEVLLDGPHDPAFQAALLARIAPASAPADAQVLAGEQSNTSIVYRPAAGHPIIAKVYRQLSAGLNPDIELLTRLSAVGSQRVPSVVGVIEGAWADPRDQGTTATGSLVFAQEFFPDAPDAWPVALSAAAAGEDFAGPAADLGVTTAHVHLDLARLFPTPDADAAARRAITEAWERRLSIALTEVPQLATHQDAIRAVYRAAAAEPWPALQRIHGDYHLGQVLRVPERGWVIIDFEGEPMRPMHERREPDLALRDIAGMLRSFDYVAGSLAQDGDVDRARRAGAWAAEARAAFLAGYAGASGTEPAGLVLDALELDKAVYEAIYEARHRPGWLAIPLAAIERLVTA